MSPSQTDRVAGHGRGSRSRPSGWALPTKPPRPEYGLVSEIARLPRGGDAEMPYAAPGDDAADLAPADGRVLATVLFTDIVGSVAIAWQLGNRHWRELLEQHDRLVRQELERCHGREIDTAGDGFFAAFERPGEAIDCACAIRRRVPTIGLNIRAGLHAGELELLGSRLVGIAAGLGARITNIAAAGEILASSTVKDLVEGAGIAFSDRGLYVLRGVPGRRRLFAIEDSSEPAQPHPARTRYRRRSPNSVRPRADRIGDHPATAVRLWPSRLPWFP
jgi:class 3 adenylate cyclase